MQILADGVVDCDSFITDIRPLDDIQQAFEQLTASPQAIKSMIKVGDTV